MIIAHTSLANDLCMSVCVCVTGCVRCYDRLTPYSSIYEYYKQTATFVPILFFFAFIFNFIIHSAKAIKKLLRKHAIYILYYVYYIYIHHIHILYMATDNTNARLAALHNDLTNCAINTV